MEEDIRDRILEMVDEGMLGKDLVIEACMKFMTAEEVAKMVKLNEWSLDDDEDFTQDEIDLYGPAIQHGKD